jgi:putative ABC transport system substrate-binding protein
MKRREFLALVGGAAAARPLAANAQQPAMPVIGFLNSGSAPSPQSLAAFHAGLKESGFIEGQNVTIEHRTADGKYDRLSAFAADLVGRKVNVIVANGSPPSAFAARTATTTIPIVFLFGADPVRIGLVASLNRPGGNITGISTFGSENEIVTKQLELLRELIPNARAFALLVNPKNPTHGVDKSRWRRIADALGVTIEIISASSEGDYDPAIASLADKPVDAVYVVADSFFGSFRRGLIAALANHAMPAMFTNRQYAVEGGLICYGSNLSEAQRHAGIYTGRILKGDKPADLPVVRPTKFDLAINLKTAKALRLTVPDSLLMQATEVIE